MPRMVFVNRYFHPDISATSQMLSDLAFALAEQGHEVVVITSRQIYDQPTAGLTTSETVRGVRVYRIWTTTFGRGRLLGRAIDYLTFYMSAAWRLLRSVSVGDTVIAKTDPPLISVIAAVAARLRGAQLVNWIQDLFPEVALALGVKSIKPLSPLLLGLRDRSLRAARMNVVLGEHMAERVAARGVSREHIRIIPNWTDGRLVYPVPSAGNSLRQAWGFAEKFVIGYSGNMGRAHEFMTVIESAFALRQDPTIAFLFIGAGAQRSWLEDEFGRRGINNVHFRPYQPRERLAQSLSVPDVHVVTLRESLEGLIVPSKYYGIAAAGRAVVHIGDTDGEIARILHGERCGYAVHRGDAQGLTDLLRQLSRDPEHVQNLGHRARMAFVARFDQPIAVQKWREVLALSGEQTTLHETREAAQRYLAQTESAAALSPEAKGP